MAEHDVAALDALADQPVTVDGESILLTRFGDTVHAVGATCPHAGAPLAAGVRNGEQIICPWHKAIFCLRTGALLEPPAVDALPRYDVRIADGRVLVTTPAATPDEPAAAVDQRHFVLIGAGGAGALAAQTLREAGFGGRITMLDAENRVPYDRTLLSKYYLSGQPGAEKTPLQSQAFYQQHQIRRRTARVTGLDVRTRRITCEDGSALTYDAALVATGGNPVRPELPGIDHAFLLRGRADADAILAQAERSTTAVVLGASFIGLEVAASLRERGLSVTVVGREATPLEKQLGPRVGGAFVGLHRDRGVAFRPGQEVKAVEPGGVVLETGERLPADLIVAGFGIRPATGFIENLPLNDDGSITVDAGLRAGDGLYAAGDVARFPYRGDAIRVEHWRVAQQHGRIAAASMLGQDARYDAVPVFWTIQFMKRLDYIGHAADWDEVVIHGDIEKPEFLAYYVKDGLVAAAAGIDRDEDTAALIALFNRRGDWTAKELGTNPARLLRGV